jgi:hypothetical protein
LVQSASGTGDYKCGDSAPTATGRLGACLPPHLVSMVCVGALIFSSILTVSASSCVQGRVPLFNAPLMLRCSRLSRRRLVARREASWRWGLLFTLRLILQFLHLSKFGVDLLGQAGAVGLSAHPAKPHVGYKHNLTNSSRGYIVGRHRASKCDYEQHERT